ncbi:hypothetical protein FB45DRAFT_211941 [Roridomyces roridus]|uniref:Uncharacterized protein n=1 Tax=Roridomyces roridus TaxID=1738132 RepID=A0AAD7FXG7_9AGAR|nr:hypothetical protein FB45DRAFT_211941 [Roridomyces roridus]
MGCATVLCTGSDAPFQSYTSSSSFSLTLQGRMASTTLTALVPYLDSQQAVHGVTEKGRWALILTPSPGRTLNEVYSSVGKALETHANRAAHRWGLGPSSVAENIKTSFGEQEERCAELARLKNEVPPKLERSASKLMKYTLSTESAKTQIQAFKAVVDLATLFPDLRLLFLRSTCMREVLGSKDDISDFWKRPNDDPTEDWTFWCNLAATSLADTSLPEIMDSVPIPQLANCLMDDGGLSVIERLLVAHDCETVSSFPRALCVRYLTGILEMPGFWMNAGAVHGDVAKKLCLKLVQILTDIDLDVMPSDAPLESQAPFDYEGVDSFADIILLGISNWLGRMVNYRLQPWFECFCQAVQLLRSPRSAIFLPKAFLRATDHALEALVPTILRTVELDIAVEARRVVWLRIPVSHGMTIPFEIPSGGTLFRLRKIPSARGQTIQL